MINTIKSLGPKERVIINGLGSAMLYGTWAWFVNYSHGWLIGLRSAGTQAFTSLVSGLLLAGLLEWVAKTFPKKLHLLGGFLVMTFICLLHATAHYISGTPNILVTVGPVFVMGNSYTVLYLKFVHYQNNLNSEKELITELSN